MSNIGLVVPALGVLVHNLVAAVAALVVVLLLSEVVVRGVLRISALALRASVFKAVTDEQRGALRKRVRRQALLVVTFFAVGLVVAALAASFTGHRAVEFLQAAQGRFRGEDFASIEITALSVGGIMACALVVDMMAKAITAALGKGLSTSTWLIKQKDAQEEGIKRLRAALRVVILAGAMILTARTLGLSELEQRRVTLVVYALIGVYGARFAVGLGYILVDLIFETSAKLSTFESPLRHLGGLKHLGGLTKRTVDYLAYIGTATWVAGEVRPDTWLARAGKIGISIIAIFYTSRVLVELCGIFVNEIFLGKAEKEEPGTLQQKKTLLPVALGLMRYGIYFSGLLMALRTADVDTTPLLAGAGVLGVAVGFGAQAFVGDIVAGFFILFENLILVGDLVEVASVRGHVEEVGVRLTKIRDDSGVLHAIPNGEVRKVANHSRSYVNAVVDVHVPYDEDLKRVRALLTSIAEDALEEETGKRGPLEVDVEELSEGSVLVRVTARVPPGKDDDVGNVLRARIVDGLHSAGVGAPRARRAVLIDSTLRVGAPLLVDTAEEDEGPPNPFEPPSESE